MTKIYWTLQQASDHYGVHYTTMLRMVHEGAVPGAFKVRRQWRIPVGALEGEAALHDRGEEPHPTHDFTAQ